MTEPAFCSGSTPTAWNSTSSATLPRHLWDQKAPLQLIMAKTRPKSPRTVMRYVKPGDEAVAEVISLLGAPRRSH